MLSRSRRAEARTAPAWRTAGHQPRRSWSWLDTPLTLSVAGGLLMWAALPPLGWSALAWVAPLPWLRLVQRPDWTVRHPYWQIWIGSSLHWLAVLQGIRLPYWVLYFGWIALSLYLASYLPCFVAAARVAVHRCRWPLVMAAPIAWVATELARGHVITGFSGALLGHTQLSWTSLIQISDLAGAYAVSFLVMTVAACLWRSLSSWRSAVAHLAVAAGLLLAALAYGHLRLEEAPGPTRARVALLQGTYDTIFEYNPERNLDMFRQYLGLAEQASRAHPDLDLIVWPESTFTENNPHWILGPTIHAPPRTPLSPEEYAASVRERNAAFVGKAQEVARLVNGSSAARSPLRTCWQFVGVETVDLRESPSRSYNSGLLLDNQGRIAQRYDKMHLVMFGEYIPLARWFPVLYQWSPMAGGLTPGAGPVALRVAGLRFSPTICFESFVPHLVRRQLHMLARSGESPDVLVNITHDGWFWGSSILDLHLTCSAFRAVEHRRPMLVAANPGISAWITGDGRIVRQLERQRAGFIFAEVWRDGRFSLYSLWGDALPSLCVIVVAMWWGCAWWQGRSQRRAAAS